MRWISTSTTATSHDQLDKALFAFASYNAGAGRISTLRKQPPSADWIRTFGFTTWSMSPRKDRSRTVTYVSNIYKYYIAYRLIVDARTEKDRAAETIKGDGK